MLRRFRSKYSALAKTLASLVGDDFKYCSVELGDRCPIHCMRSNNPSGSLALASIDAIVDRARWLVMSPRASRSGTPALRHSIGIKAKLTYVDPINRPRYANRKSTNSPVFRSGRRG